MQNEAMLGNFQICGQLDILRVVRMLGVRVGIAGGLGGSTTQLSFQPTYSLLFFNYHDFNRALLSVDSPSYLLGIPALLGVHQPTHVSASIRLSLCACARALCERALCAGAS